MRQHDHTHLDARKAHRAWPKLVQTLLHLCVVLGGSLGLQQTVASAAVAALADAQTRGELTIARDGTRASLVSSDKRTPDPSSTPKRSPAATAPPVPKSSQDQAPAKPLRFAAQLFSKRSAHSFQARAPPRKS